MAVGDSAAVASGFVFDRIPTDGGTNVETVVDAAAGATTRYVDADADFGRLAEARGSPDVFTLRTHDEEAGLAGSVAAGLAYRLAPDESELEASVVFEAGSVDEEAVAEWAGEASFFRGEPVKTDTTDRVVTAAASVRTGDIDSFGGKLPDRADRPEPERPYAAFEFDYDEREDGTGVLEATHDGGDRLDPEELFVRGEGFADVSGVDQTSAGPWHGTASGDDGAVVSGDSVTVGVTAAYDVSIAWESADSDASATLASDRGPEA